MGYYSINKMKIGIFTLPLYSNYGGLLQAYALQKVLKNMGHEVVTIKEEKQLPSWKKPFVYSKRFLFKYVLKKKGAIDVFYEKSQKAILPIITRNTQLFIDKYIDLMSLSDVKKHQKKIGALIVGSDQVWRPKYVGSISNAYLAFAKKWNIKRIAYAPSFGTDAWEYNIYQSLTCRKLIKRFDAISTRENAGVSLCKEYWGINAVHVLDPTMLLDASHYTKLIGEESVEKCKGNLFVYVLDKNENITKVEQKICQTFGYTPFYSSTDNSGAMLENRIASKVETWLQSFIDAEFILTDSFHACVFSILFNKPFIVCGNVGRGMSRFDSLLQTFNLQNRKVSIDINNLDQALQTSINWEEVNRILDIQRENSFQFLSNALK